MSCPVFVLGSGTYLPGEAIPFSAINAVLGPLPEAPPRLQRWMEATAPVMEELLDIRWVHYAFDPTTRRFFDDNVTMSVQAARLALERAGLEPRDLDLICYGSAQLQNMPTTSVRIQEALGIEVCDELCFHANCTSAYKALYVAHQLVRHGKNRCALVVSSNVSSAELMAEYYNQQAVDKESLFLRWFLGDGAGALVIGSESARAARKSAFLLEASYIESIGGGRPSLMFNRRPAHPLPPLEEHAQGLHHLRQRFRDELANGLFHEPGGSIFIKGLERMMREAEVPLSRVRHLHLNLPAKHIVASLMDECEALGLPRSVLYAKLDQLGYCGPPMALIGLDHLVREAEWENDDRAVSFVTEVSKFMQAGCVIRHADV